MPTTPGEPTQETTVATSADGTLVVLDVHCPDLNHCLDEVLGAIEEHQGLAGPQREEVLKVLRQHADLGPDALEHGVAIIHEQLRVPGADVRVLVRLAPALEIFDDDGLPTHFLWILLSGAPTHEHLDTATEFASLMGDEDFRASAIAAPTPEALDALYTRALDEQLHFTRKMPLELQPTGRPFGALRADVRRRLPFYASDFRDGLNAKSLASTIFLFFACLAPSVAFGGLLTVMTDGAIGVVETLVATTITGVAYALLSAQPLSILGSTGPVVVFIGMLYALCEQVGVPYLPTLAWVGFWTSGFLILLVAIDAAAWIRFFTRFVDETFAALIALIYTWEALRDIGHTFTDHKVSYATALLSLVLALGTYIIATQLSRFRQSDYLRRGMREFLADFGPTIALFTMTAVAYAMHEVELETLAVPQTFGTTAGRSWFVNPLDAPPWVRAAAAVPALLGAILVYLDQNITVRLVNNPQNRLKKGAGYHLDMLVVAVLVGVFALFGLPWTVAATVRSLNHVRSLADTEVVHGKERIVGVTETRVTHLAIHLLIGGSLLLLPLLSQIPMSVLFGLFLFMGIASMKGNQFFERLRLWAMDPTRYPPTYYLRAVPTRVVHRYTFIQALALGLLWVVKASPAGLLFPLFIALLVPVRMVLDKLFKAEHLALLDAEEAPREEEFHIAGP